jgi:hypothetical protein
MSAKSTTQPTPPLSAASALEMLRGQIVELEAVCHAAEDALQYLPYVPRASSETGQEDALYTDRQLGIGRLQALVAAGSSASRVVLRNLDGLLESVQEPNHRLRMDCMASESAPERSSTRLGSSSPQSILAVSSA